MAKFNDRLKLLRRESGLSQQDIAKQLRLSKSSINMYERGEREPGLEALEAIADFFNVDMDYLLGKSEHRNKSAWLNDSFDVHLDVSSPLPDITEGEVSMVRAYRCADDRTRQMVDLALEPYKTPAQSEEAM